VRARSGNGDSAYSNAASATTSEDHGGPTAPAAPEGLAAAAEPGGGIALTWVDRSSDEESFVVEHEETSGFRAISTLSANVQDAEIAGLAAGRLHRFRVKARNASGDSPYSNIASVALPTPAVPAGPWLETPEIPGFRFKARLGGERAATSLRDCVAATLCLGGGGSSAVALLQVTGPRFNNKLWVTAVQFTLWRVEVWIEQRAGGALRYYDLVGLPASTATLGGVNDPQAFLPAPRSGAELDRLVFRDVAEGPRATENPPPVPKTADPVPPAGEWLATREFSGYLFKARLGEGTSVRNGTAVLDCTPRTLCIAGPRPDRAALFLRLLGPRTDGTLWAQIARFTVDPVEVWIEQTDSGKVRYYRLGKLPAATHEILGLNDSQAFRP